MFGKSERHTSRTLLGGSSFPKEGGGRVIKRPSIMLWCSLCIKNHANFMILQSSSVMREKTQEIKGKGIILHI